MGNREKSKIGTIYSAAKKLPYFSLNNLAGFKANKTYLKILFSRYEKAGKVIRLKKGLYVAKEYLDNLEKAGKISDYLNFLSSILYKPSYLSLDYILYKHNILTELPVNFTSVTMNKTASFSNKLGNFIYHKVKDSLFCGFKIVKEGDFSIPTASKAKTLFDYLYLRKNHLINKKAAEELRLNLLEFKRSDKTELEKYVKLEGSKKMKEIYHYFF